MLFLTMMIFAFGCTKDENKPSEEVNELIGKWKGVKWEEFYQNENGTPFRTNWIEEDDFETDIIVDLLINDKTMKFSGEDVYDDRKKELPYVRHKDYLEVTISGKKVRFDYELKGNSLKVTETQMNYIYEEDLIIPKVITTETFERQK